MRVPNHSPRLDKSHAFIDPEKFYHCMGPCHGGGVLRKASGTFPDSNSVLDQFLSASISLNLRTLSK